MAISVNPNNLSVQGQANQAAQDLALKGKDKEAPAAVKAAGIPKGVAGAMPTDKMGFAGAAQTARGLDLSAEATATSEAPGDVAGAYRDLAVAVTNGADPAEGVKVAGQGDMPMSGKPPAIGLGLGFIASALKKADLSPEQDKALLQVVGTTNGLSTEEQVKAGVQIPPQLQAIILQGLKVRPGMMDGVNLQNEVPPTDVPPTDPTTDPPTDPPTSTPTTPPAVAATPPADPLTLTPSDQAAQIASGKVVIPDGDVLKMETLIQPVVANMAGMDIDAMVQMVLEQAGNSADDDLASMVKDMQVKLKEKNAQRAKISALQKGQATLTSEIQEKFFQMKSDGELPAGMTQDQFSAQVKVAWGEGMTTPDGQYIGPTPTIVEPIVITDPSAVGSGGGAAPGPSYGLSTDQLKYMTDAFNALPNKADYSSFDDWMSKAVGIKPATDVAGALANQTKAKAFADGLGTSATSAADPAAVTAMEALLNGIAPALAGPSDLEKMEQLAERVSVEEAMYKLHPTDTLATTMTADQQALSDAFGKASAGGLSGDDQTKLNAFVNVASPTSLSGFMDRFAAQMGALADYAGKLNDDTLNTDAEGIESDNHIRNTHTTFDPLTGLITVTYNETEDGWDDTNNRITQTFGDGKKDDWRYARNMSAPEYDNTINLGDGKTVDMGPPPKLDPDMLALLNSVGGGATLTADDLKNLAGNLGSVNLGGAVFAPKAGDASHAPDQTEYDNAFGTATADAAQLTLIESLPINANGEPYFDPDDPKCAGIDADTVSQLQSEGLLKLGKSPSALIADTAAAAAQAQAKAQAKADFDKNYGTGQTNDPAMQFTQTGTLAQLGSALDSAKSNLDSMNEMSQMDSMRLQQAMDQRQSMFSTLSNLMKKVSDTQDGIVNNLK